VEAKLSPTNTESIYGLFRSRLLEREAKQDGPFARSLLHWELYSGAKSTIIPGIAPTVTYTAIYDDNRLASSSTSTSTTTSTGTGALGGTPVLAPVSLMSPSVSALTPVGPGTISVSRPRAQSRQPSGGVGDLPGAMVEAAGPAAIQPTVSIADNETSVDQIKTQYNRVYRFETARVGQRGASSTWSCINCIRRA